MRLNILSQPDLVSKKESTRHQFHLPNRSSHEEHPNQYVHRCPFRHCPHASDTDYYRQPEGIKIPLMTTVDNDLCPKIRQNNHIHIKQGHYIARGSLDFKVTADVRQKAITYMMARMSLDDSMDSGLYRRLLNSISSLEHQVYVDSDTKEEYIEKLATKLFLIFKELEHRQNLTKEQSKPT